MLKIGGSLRGLKNSAREIVTRLAQRRQNWPSAKQKSEKSAEESCISSAPAAAAAASRGGG